VVKPSRGGGEDMRVVVTIVYRVYVPSS
jgi:hypothetical protein